MVVTLHPGANRGDLLEVLTRIRAEAGNATGPGNAGAAGRLTGYLEWAARSARMLHNRIKAADIDRLILTRGYNRLLAAVGGPTGIQRVLKRPDKHGSCGCAPRRLTRSSATCGARARSGAPTTPLRRNGRFWLRIWWDR